MREPIQPAAPQHAEPIRPLGGMRSGRAAIVALPNEEAAELAALGILPGAEVEVVQATPFRGPILVRAGGSVYALGRTLADRIPVIPR